MGVITYNGISSDSLGLVVEYFPKRTFPQRDLDFVHIPGRNGDLVMDKGSYQNVSIEYDIAFVRKDLKDEEVKYMDRNTSYSFGVARIGSWLHSASGYARLEDTYDPDCYRMATYSESINIENILMEAGRATINFNAKPQRWLKEGDIWMNFSTYITSHSPVSPFGGYVENPTKFPSKPLIKIRIIGALINHGSNIPESIMFSIGEYSVEIRDLTSFPKTETTIDRYPSSISAEEIVIYIDCDQEDVYMEGEYNPNSHVTLTRGFPIINDRSSISLSKPNTIDQNQQQIDISIQGRWWTL